VMRALAFAALVGLSALVGAPATGRATPRGSDPSSAADLWSAAEISRATQQRPAPVVDLQDLRGNRVDLRQFHGRVVLLYFWGSW